MTTINNNQWDFFPENQEVTALLSNELNISPLISKLLINRGVSNSKNAAIFLNPLLKDLHDPFLMKDMQKSVERIILAIKNKEKIMVYGDYDVDGVTATSLLILFFREIGITIDYYIPNRLTEGYGLNLSAIKNITEKKYNLLITVDCGITNFTEIEEANKSGIETIITDHHQLPAKLPQAFSILNPAQEDCRYPFKYLSGAGIVYKLLTALRTTLRSEETFKDITLPNLKKHLDLVCLSTLADVVPLVGENHVLAKYGLKEIETSSKPGLIALIEKAGLKNKTIDVYAVNFMLVPRLNAAGRIAHANISVELLISDQPEPAKILAAQLEQINRERQKLQEKTFKAVKSILRESSDLENKNIIILSSHDWHLGVIGIVAAKIAEEYLRPCILICLDENGQGKGSARSIPSFDLYAGLKLCAPFLENFGGHKYAAGITIKEKNIPGFTELLNRIFLVEAHNYLPLPKLLIDANLDLNEITMNLAKEIDKLEPYGNGNPRPLFVINNSQIAGEYNLMGKNSNHVKFYLKKTGTENLEVVSFNQNNISHWPETKETVDLVFSLEINNWNGNNRIQLKLKDMRTNKK